jgi:hypothetical protein
MFFPEFLKHRSSRMADAFHDALKEYGNLINKNQWVD